ncbi:MAG: helix-turn-helix transcriptional regulator [Thermoleophilia bacterium]|nr:helix-turn-helix transcriptional regulator [Thermoleophilia bacterium]
MSRKHKLGYVWHLRRLMAEHGMFATTDLQPHLVERGITLSSVQVYRLVAQTPERLNLNVLVALCDILGCTPTELIEPIAVPRKARKTASASDPVPAPANVKPKRARIARDAKKRS